MNVKVLSDIDLLDVGNTILLGGGIWVSKDTVFLVPFPDVTLNVEQSELLLMDDSEWERFLHQTDVLDVRGPGKAILRKSQRVIDQNIAWQVYKRDSYRCRYCGREAPLTVDHVILWENGGATVPENLVSSCRRCNKLRGNMEYDKWIDSEEYTRVSSDLHYSNEPDAINYRFYLENEQLVDRLDDLRKITVKPRSR